MLGLVREDDHVVVRATDEAGSAENGRAAARSARVPSG
jgi:hypothetical protein